MTTRRQAPVLDRLITRDVQGPSPGRDAFNQPIPGPITTVRLWAARRDFAARDFIQVTTGGLITIMDSRYIIRSESWPDAAPADTFTDDDGAMRTVQGVSQVLGGRYLELLARRVSS